MEDPTQSDAHVAAQRTLDAFASVGAMKFDLTLTTCQGEKVSFSRAVGFEEISLRIPNLLDRATNNQWNVIVRPKPPPVFLQLDDLGEPARDRVQDVSFLSLETSAGNYQAWIALLGATERDQIRRLKKEIGADLTASGATRIAGSLNFKVKYSPSFPCVSICHVNPGVLVSVLQLSEIGLVSLSEPGPDSPVRGTLIRRFVNKWPSYERCVAGAPFNHEGTAPDHSRADFTFCLIAIDWGWSIEETAARLMDESAKARENGSKYAQLTAERAADAVHRRQ